MSKTIERDDLHYNKTWSNSCHVFVRVFYNETKIILTKLGKILIGSFLFFLSGSWYVLTHVFQNEIQIILTKLGQILIGSFLFFLLGSWHLLTHVFHNEIKIILTKLRKILIGPFYFSCQDLDMYLHMYFIMKFK